MQRLIDFSPNYCLCGEHRKWNWQLKKIQWEDANATENSNFANAISAVSSNERLLVYYSIVWKWHTKILWAITDLSIFHMLSIFHNTDNEQKSFRWRLSKISNLLDLLRPKFKKSYILEELVCIDESDMPFRGWIHFRQYILNKKHKYKAWKIKVLCVRGSYTRSFKVYRNKEEKAVSDLTDGLLDNNVPTTSRQVFPS